MDKQEPLSQFGGHNLNAGRIQTGFNDNSDPGIISTETQSKIPSQAKSSENRNFGMVAKSGKISSIVNTSFFQIGKNSNFSSLFAYRKMQYEEKRVSISRCTSWKTNFSGTDALVRQPVTRMKTRMIL